MDDRTEKIMDIFGLTGLMNCDDNDIDKFKFNNEEILSLELTDYDNYRIFQICDFIRTEDMNLREKIREREGYKSIDDEEMESNFRQSKEELEECKLWKVGKKIKHLLSLTKPSAIKEINLPFNEFFIDEDFSFGEQRVFGIKISKGEINVFGVLNDFLRYQVETEQNKNISKEDLDKNFNEDCVFIRYGLFDGEEFRSVFIVYDYKKMKSLTNRKGEIDKTITNFVSNLLLFLNEPRIVTYIQQPNNKRRERKGKIPLPSLIKTRIEIGLENYIEKIYFNGLSNSKLDFSFWVRGHWRKLLSPRFKNKQGQNIWIAPYICGEGIMPPQVFEVC